MRLLTPAITLGIIAILLASAMATATPPPVDEPTPASGNGTPETPEPPVTSGQPRTSAVGDQESTRGLLSALTDLPQATPPRDVQRHNRQAHRALPETAPATSLYPAGTDLTDGRFVADAYASIFAVQPSTVARISPSRTPQYVPPDGEVLGRIDYRVALPANTTKPDRRVSWRLKHHDIDTVRLLVDGTPATTTTGTQNPTLSYTSLGGTPGASHELTLAATISITVERRVAACSHHVNRTDPAPSLDGPLANSTTGNPDVMCLEWTERVHDLSEQLTVRTSRQVRTYAPSVRGYRARFPAGDTGLVVQADQPVAGLQYDGGHVDSIWRFYTTNATGWASMVRSRADGDEREPVGRQPRRVVAYPSRVGVAPSDRATTTVDAVHGPTREPPSVPRDVDLAVVTEPYTATTGLTIHKRGEHDIEDLRLSGLVAGTDVRVHERLTSLTVHRPTLRLTVIERTRDHVLLEVQLRDATSGDPIATTDRRGSIRVGGRRVNTDADGTVRLKVAHQPDAYTARFDPGPLGSARPAYAPATDTLYVRRPSLSATAVVGTLIAPAVSILVVSFLLDRMTGWDLWPPWREY